METEYKDQDHTRSNRIAIPLTDVDSHLSLRDDERDRIVLPLTDAGVLFSFKNDERGMAVIKSLLKAGLVDIDKIDIKILSRIQC